MTLHSRLLVLVALLGCATSTEPRRVESAVPRGPYVVDLVATKDSFCYAWSTGEVQCTTSRGPETIRGAEGIVSVAAFEHRVCGLTRDGSVACWNAAHGGVSEASILSATNASEVVVGSFVVCWSHAGRISCDGNEALMPWTPPDGDGWASLSLGRLHGCGLRRGIGACWGRGDRRAVDGSSRRSEDLSVSFPSVLRHERLREVRAHLARTCAVTQDGALWCFGPLDLLRELDGSTPADLVRIEGVWTHVFLGRDVTCALDREGRPHCWGVAAHGLLGPHVRADRECAFPMADATPTPVPCTSRPIPIELVRVSKMTLGDRFACAMDEGYNVFCWGSNEQAQIAYPPSPLPHYQPTLVARGLRDVGNGGGP
jgi:hypothetical protein